MATNEWVITVEAATDHALGEELLIDLDDLAESRDANVSNLGGGAGFAVRSRAAGSPGEVAEHAIEFAEKLGAHAGIDVTIASVLVETEKQAEKRAVTYDTPPLLAATDVAELLGISRQRVHQLATDRADFPAPYARLGSGPIWTRPAIEAFDRLWTRKPGRPAKAAGV